VKPSKSCNDLANEIEETIETDCKDPNAFAIILEGDSMEPEFRAGDNVVFAPNLEPRKGDFAVVKLNSGKVYFKQFERTGPEGSMVKLSSINPNYTPMEFEAKDVAFVYPAWEVRRRLRK
jgi:phage repressor protein C with HTH and peptisase S24 domain